MGRSKSIARWPYRFAERIEVLRIASSLQMNNYEVAGRLMNFMEWASSEGLSEIDFGSLEGAARCIDSVVGVDGISMLLHAEGLIFMTVDGVLIVSSIFNDADQQRSAGAERQRRYRARQKAAKSANDKTE